MWEWTTTSTRFVSSAIGLVAQNPEWALVVAFLAAIIEAVAIVGTFLPGTFIVMGVAGAAAAAGQPMLPFLAVAVAGAVHRRFSVLLGRLPLTASPCGNGGPWRSGRTDGRRRPVLRAIRRPIAWRCAGSFPVLRSTVPLVAGIAGMSRRRFLIANVASALVWAPAHVCPAQWPVCRSTSCATEMADGGCSSARACWPSALLVWLLHRRLSPLLIAARRSGQAAAAFQPPGAPCVLT